MEHVDGDAEFNPQVPNDRPVSAVPPPMPPPIVVVPPRDTVDPAAAVRVPPVGTDSVDPLVMVSVELFWIEDAELEMNPLSVEVALVEKPLLNTGIPVNVATPVTPRVPPTVAAPVTSSVPGIMLPVAVHFCDCAVATAIDTAGVVS